MTKPDGLPVIDHATAADRGARLRKPFCILRDFSMTNKTNQNPVEKRYSEIEALRILGFKNRLTLWRWRRRGLLGYYRIANKIEYGEHHLSDFLARCERKPKAIREVA